MLVHLIIKNTETSFVVAEAKASVNNEGVVAAEADTASAEQEFILFLEAHGNLYHYDPPKGLENHQVAELYDHAARVCQDKGLRIWRPSLQCSLHGDLPYSWPAANLAL